MKNNYVYFLFSIPLILTKCEPDTVNHYNWNFYLMTPNGTKKIDNEKTTVPVVPVVCEDTQVLKGGEIYWRDFHGIVPKDALMVVKSFEKVTEPVSLHIGQVLVNEDGSGVQPVQIRNDSSEVTSYYTRAITTEDNIKILCTNVEPHLENMFLKWIPLKDIDKVDLNALIVTGWERIKDKDGAYDYVYSGRAVRNGKLVVGKVAHMREGWTFVYTIKQNTVVNDANFEILAYATCCQVKS